MRRILFAVSSLVFSASMVSQQFGCDSPVGSTISKAVKQYTEWGPEQIEKDPAGYLNYVKNECDRTASDIEAVRITLRGDRSKLQAEAAAARANLDRYREQLKDYKQAYREGEASGKWPVSVRGGPRMSQLDLQTVILEKHQQVETAEQQAAENPSLVQRIDNRLADLEIKEVQVRQSKIKAEKKLKDLRLGHVYTRVDEIEIKLASIDPGIDSLGDVRPNLQLADVATPVNPKQTSFDGIMAK